jgi:hypothetical protein
MITLHTILVGAFLLTVGLTSLSAQQTAAAEELAHTRTEFHFTADASFEQTAPLFGADEERKWAPDWKPQFVYPNPARDQQGMIFQVAHGSYTSTWVNTAYDLAAGHIQYAYVLNDAMVTMIDIHLVREGAEKTAVTVLYERTALLPEANEHVQHFAKGDEKAGKEWEQQINGYLAQVQKQSTKN